MDVKLISYTPNPEILVASAARICYSSDSCDKILEDLSEFQINRLLNIIISGGHHSALEHAVFTFSISGISRACTHQLVRHRLASYNQQSQRYVEFDSSNLFDHAEFVFPQSIQSDTFAKELFESFLENSSKVYTTLVEMGIPKEDARYALPNSAKSNIVVTMNARELLHFFSLRCCNRAQWEIKELADSMLRCVKAVAPKLFETAGPECVRTSCKEGKMCCGNPRSLSEFVD